MLQFLVTTLQCDNIRCSFQNFEHIYRRLMCPHARFLSTSKFLTANRHNKSRDAFPWKLESSKLINYDLCSKLIFMSFLFHTPREIGARH